MPEVEFHVPHLVAKSNKSSYSSLSISCVLNVALVQSFTHVYASNDSGAIEDRVSSKILPPVINACSMTTVEIELENFI